MNKNFSKIKNSNLIYKITKDNNGYCIWKIEKSPCGIGYLKIFSGTENSCFTFLNHI